MSYLHKSCCSLYFHKNVSCLGLGLLRKCHVFFPLVKKNAAYDSINSKMLYSAMEKFGISLKLVRLVKLTMAWVQCLIRVQSHLSNPLQAKTGLRQGDILACLLFNVALERVLRDSGIKTRGTDRTDVRLCR
jgi:hypothetical protein